MKEFTRSFFSNFSDLNQSRLTNSLGFLDSKLDRKHSRKEVAQ